MVFESGIGYSYRTAGEAAQMVESALKSNETWDSPLHISEGARIFCSETFEERITRLVPHVPQTR